MLIDCPECHAMDIQLTDEKKCPNCNYDLSSISEELFIAESFDSKENNYTTYSLWNILGKGICVVIILVGIFLIYGIFDISSTRPKVKTSLGAESTYPEHMQGLSGLEVYNEKGRVITPRDIFHGHGDIFWSFELQEEFRLADSKWCKKRNKWAVIAIASLGGIILSLFFLFSSKILKQQA